MTGRIKSEPFTFFPINLAYEVCFSMRAKLASGEMAVSGDQWPMLVYADQEYDPEEPWDGLFRSRLLVWVSDTYFFLTY